MAIILISHNLGVVAGLSDEVAVMYAGKVVERAPAGELFERPQHPYTQALMRAIPLLESTEKEPLANIPGAPPDLVNPPAGCRFHPRCEFAFERCRHEQPVLKNVTDSHSVACWLVESDAS